MPDLQRAELNRAFISLLVTLVLMVALLFGAAGSLSWGHGWAFLIVFVLLILASMAALWRLNPEIFVARARPMGQGTKGWDRVLMPILLVAFALILPVAAFDDGRFHWAPASDVWVVLGYLLLVIGFAGVAWAQAVNRHFEPSVRIQSERDHHVIDTGPYAYIRHPGYVFASLMALGIAWSLGSWWALVPAVIVTAVLALRTDLEDATLQRELHGFAEFAAKTRFKWIPGVW